jgi:Phage integrase, N-terminal SAM-like domain
MIEDMRTAGLASGSQALYLDAVRNLVADYRRSPDELSEAEVSAYLLRLRLSR